MEVERQPCLKVIVVRHGNRYTHRFPVSSSLPLCSSILPVALPSSFLLCYSSRCGFFVEAKQHTLWQLWLWQMLFSKCPLVKTTRTSCLTQQILKCLNRDVEKWLNRDCRAFGKPLWVNHSTDLWRFLRQNYVILSQLLFFLRNSFWLITGP